MTYEIITLEELVADIRSGYIVMVDDKLQWIGSGDVDSCVYPVRLIDVESKTTSGTINHTIVVEIVGMRP